MTEKSLLTVRLDSELLTQFTNKCKANTTNKSEVVKAFIERFLNDEISIDGIDHVSIIQPKNFLTVAELKDRIAEEVNERLKKIDIDEIYSRLSAIENEQLIMLQRIENIESQFDDDEFLDKDGNYIGSDNDSEF